VKPSFIYVPTADLAGTAGFYRDELGLEEAWREGDDTVAFALPGSDVQVMVSTDPGRYGPMYEVPSARAFAAAHPGLTVVLPLTPIPGGATVGFEDPAGNAFHVFDQAELDQRD
jgi:catechol 2,3-dioxygenase-like lactoylglutathione lyase family enzyme